MGSYLRFRNLGGASHSLSFQVAAVGVALSLMFPGCRKAEPDGQALIKRTPVIAEQCISREMQEVRSILSSLQIHSASAYDHQKEILAEVTRLGALLKNLKTTEVFGLYKEIEADMKSLDSKLKAEHCTSLVRITTIGLSYASLLPAGPAEEARLGALFLSLPFIVNILNGPAIDLQGVLSTETFERISLAYLFHIIKSESSRFEAAGDSVILWARSEDPYSPQHLFLLFRTIRQ